MNEGLLSVSYPEGEGSYVVEYFSGIDTTMKSITVTKGSYGDRRYKALWDIVTYHISYDEIGVLNEVAASKVEALRNRDSYTVLDEFTLINPQKVGHKFVGWIYEGNQVPTAEEYLSIVKGTTGDKSFITVWEKLSFNVSYNLNGGEAENLPTSYTYGDALIKLENPTRDNYYFLGWSDGKTEKPIKNYIINTFAIEDLSLEAMWEPISYNISYALAGGNLPYLEQNPSCFTVEDEAFVLINPSRNYYTFEGWREIGTKDEPKLSYTVDTAIARPIELEAMWKPIEYTISYVDDGCYYKYDIVNPTSYNIESNNITIAKPYKDGYTFVGWVVSGDRTEKAYKNYEIKKGSHGDLKLFAEFEHERYPIGTITEMQLNVVEYGKNNIPRPDWVISVPSDYYGIHYEKAYANEGSFITSYEKAIKKAQIQLCNYLGTEMSVTDKTVNEVNYTSQTFEASETISGCYVVEYWEDSVGGVWILLASEY